MKKKTNLARFFASKIYEKKTLDAVAFQWEFLIRLRLEASMQKTNERTSLLYASRGIFSFHFCLGTLDIFAFHISPFVHTPLAACYSPPALSSLRY